MLGDMEIVWNCYWMVAQQYDAIWQWSDVLRCQMKWYGCISNSCIGGEHDYEGRFRESIAVWRIIQGWQISCIYRAIVWNWRVCLSDDFTQSRVSQGTRGLWNSFDFCLDYYITLLFQILSPSNPGHYTNSALGWLDHCQMYNWFLTLSHMVGQNMVVLMNLEIIRWNFANKHQVIDSTALRRAANAHQLE
jgi:hypothetical protein